MDRWYYSLWFFRHLYHYFTLLCPLPVLIFLFMLMKLHLLFSFTPSNHLYHTSPLSVFPLFVPFCFHSFCSYYRLYSHIWKLRARNFRWDRTCGICLSVPEKTITENQKWSKFRAQEINCVFPCPKSYIYNPVPVPKTRGSLWNRGQKDFKRQMNSKSAITLCLLVTSEMLHAWSLITMAT